MVVWREGDGQDGSRLCSSVYTIVRWIVTMSAFSLDMLKYKCVSESDWVWMQVITCVGDGECRCRCD